MTEVSNLEINKRSNGERPNLGVSKIGNENWFISKGKYENSQISSGSEYRMDGQFQNWQFLDPNFGFPKWDHSKNLFILQFRQFQDLQFNKFKIFQFRKF